MSNCFERLNASVSEKMTLADAISVFENACPLEPGSKDALMFESGVFSVRGENRFFFVLGRETVTPAGRMQLIFELSVPAAGLTGIERASYVSDETEDREEDSRTFFAFVRDGETFPSHKDTLFDVRLYEGNVDD